MSSELSPSSASEHLRRIESSKLFQGAVIAIIILSALTIGAKTYDLPPWVEQGLTGMDNAITAFFLIEILFRFAACPAKRRFLLDGWNLFDTIVVIGSLIPSTIPTRCCWAGCCGYSGCCAWCRWCRSCVS